MTLEEYMRELKLMQKQYGQEEELYPLIYMLLRESLDEKDKEELSIRTVANGRRNKGKVGKHFYGYSSFPDLVILDEKFDQEKPEDYKKYTYGCVEVKAVGNDLQKIETNYEINDNYTIVIGFRPTGGRATRYYYVEHEAAKDKYDEYKYYKKVDDLKNEDWIPGELFSYSVVNRVKIKSDNKVNKTDIEAPENYETVVMVENGIKLNGVDSNTEIEQLLGELLWYQKVLYTNGIKWYYIKLTQPVIGNNTITSIKNAVLSWKCIGDFTELNKIESIEGVLNEIKTNPKWKNVWTQLKGYLEDIDWKNEN